ncbi:hypothetical protein PROFUN_10690 [Planoprotostelium fungivorum]|uniref:Uncharacterized protein n=1 Tax=Planoprotostelium fungivorum TaxID=1890364 RepID=A0A2P6N9L2_9EUKA|nr:hypothetical protein PROFUN_10690 [Planoprotostelium fungivorum]
MGKVYGTELDLPDPVVYFLYFLFFFHSGIPSDTRPSNKQNLYPH